MRLMLFAGSVIAVYAAVAYARSFSAGCCGASMPAGLELTFLVCVQTLVAALVVFLAALVFRLPSLRRNAAGVEARWNESLRLSDRGK